jgi:hypothetical protein
MAELAPQEVIASLRRPKVIFTQDFIDDPIKINTDERFHPETVLRQIEDIPVSDRDGANFVIVDIGLKTPSWYPIHMLSPLYNRVAYTTHINREFKELL